MRDGTAPDCPICDGRGRTPDPRELGTTRQCSNCKGTGSDPDYGDDYWRYRALQEAIERTGYREGGAEMADTMAGKRGYPATVEDEYRRICRRYDVTPTADHGAH